MSKLTKVIVVLTLVIWGLAAMHCKLESVPGFDFLKSCCFADTAPPAADNCDSDGCGAVEDGNYRAEEPTTSAPHPLLILAVQAPILMDLAPKSQLSICISSEFPPELANVWQFFERAAIPPRPPSLTS